MKLKNIGYGSGRGLRGGAGWEADSAIFRRVTGKYFWQNRKRHIQFKIKCRKNALIF